MQVPLTHQEIGGLQSYSDLLRLPTYRFPGFSTIRRNDVVVFHVPHEPQRPTELPRQPPSSAASQWPTTTLKSARQVFLNEQPRAVRSGASPQTTYFLQVRPQR
ncbi:MAG: hypothetical protein WKG07_11715 [Hymenobacter sp.]